MTSVAKKIADKKIAKTVGIKVENGVLALIQEVLGNRGE